MSFNPDAFLDMSVDVELSTQTIPVPTGTYPAVCQGIVGKPWQSKKDPSKSGYMLDLTWEIADESVAALVGRPVVKVKQTIMLDMTEDGQLITTKGSNVGLGRLRAALGMNEAGRPFSIRAVVGQAANVTVTHRPDTRDGVEPGAVFAEVSQVSSLA